MEAELVKTFRFEASHRLPNVPAGHKCGRLHGHSYRVDIHVTGPVGEHSGWVMDFAEITAIVRPIVDRLDHQDLAAIEGLENSTSERIAAWLWGQIKPALPSLSAITVCESDSSRCIYRGQ